LERLVERYFAAAYFWRLDPTVVLGKTIAELEELEAGMGVVNALLKRK
jgi:hypothetical protein